MNRENMKHDASLIIHQSVASIANKYNGYIEYTHAFRLFVSLFAVTKIRFSLSNAFGAMKRLSNLTDKQTKADV